jgi:hypothetical protein
MGARTTAAFNPTLTNYAQGLAQDLASATANFLAPIVEVPAGLGRYKQFDEKNAFQIYNTERALGGPATRIQFAASDPTFDCRPQALEAGIDDAEYDAAGADNAVRLEESRVRTLLTSATLAHEDKVYQVAKTVSAVGGKGNWSNASVDPVAEIDEQIEALATTCGVLPNRIVFGLGAWRVARNHAKVINRMPSNAAVGVLVQQFAAMLMNPNMEIRIGVLSKDTTRFGAAKSATNLIGAEVFVFLGQDTPSEFDPSFMKTFMTRSGGVDAVRTYRDESTRSTVHAVDWSEDVKITGSMAVKRLTIT